MKNLPATLRAYRLFSYGAAPFLPFLLRRRLKRGKEDAARLNERLGRPSRPRPEGRLIWLHGASVGETMSILPLVERLVAYGAVMLTTGTVTSAKLVESRLPAGAFHQFVPLDSPGAVARFFAHWKPDLGLLCESELWPNLIIEAHRQGISLGIINGRMSDRSFRRWSKLRGFIRALLAPLAFCSAQSEGDAERYRALGASSISPGNLKFDVPPLPFSADEFTSLRTQIGARPVLVAASTHPGEESQVIEAARAIAPDIPDLLTILVPRHPQRGEEIASLLREIGIPPLRRSLGAEPEKSVPFYIADTLGELGLFYRLGTLALIGGSLVEHGGHNPIEAIKCGCPCISGPHIDNFKDVFADLVTEEGTKLFAPGETLADGLRHLLDDPDARSVLHAKASKALAQHEGALERTIAALAPLLKPGGR
ncbi:MAG: 3-deoxy-D-manno-octulosonic acid transferase [Rhizobiales bacterium]|nr:3-deoxy-D-manno-octulosonic acid transferase [Hyphomicrobiales bacterium]